MTPHEILSDENIERAARDTFAMLTAQGVAAPEMDENNFNGLQCDAPNCDWSDMTIPFEQYEAHVNAPCPKCGSNILTEEDWTSAQVINRVFKRVGEMFKEAGFKPDATMKPTPVRLKSDTKGLLLPVE